MPIPLHLEKIVQFNEISTEWNLIKVSADWNGFPLLLFEEGRPPFPMVASEELTRWYQTVPAAHHIVHFDNGKYTTITIRNDVRAKITSFVQRFENKWLLVESRGGNGHVYSQEGVHLKTLSLGDAINDVQATADGHIWVSYFDEGVFGNGIGTNGLVCFDAEGNDISAMRSLHKQQNSRILKIAMP